MTRLPRIIDNDDSCSLSIVDPPHHEDRISRVLDYMENSRIDRICWSMFGGWTAQNWYSNRIENLFDLNRKEHPERLRLNAMYSLYRQNIDYIPRLIDCCRDCGKEFFASIRMNDCHLRGETNEKMLPEFWRRNQDKRLWELTTALSYYNALLDYSYPEVRDLVFNVIDELAGRYDLDGFELDFMRQEWAFNPGEAWEKRGILTDFLARIRTRLKQGNAAGRVPGLMVRVPFSPQQRMEGGFDLAEWMDRRLIDLAAGCANTIDFMPDLADITALGRKYGIPVFGDIELFPVLFKPNKTELTAGQVQPGHSYGHRFGIEEFERMAYAMCDVLRGWNVDGLYMFNYPCFRNDCVARGIHRTEEEMRVFKRLLENIGGDNFSGGPLEYRFWPQMPIYAESMRPERFFQTLELSFGSMPSPEEEVGFNFRCYGAPNPHSLNPENCAKLKELLEVRLDGVRVSPADIAVADCPAGTIPSGYRIGRHEQWTFGISGARFHSREFKLSFFMPVPPGGKTPYIYIHDLCIRRSGGGNPISSFRERVSKDFCRVAE